MTPELIAAVRTRYEANLATWPRFCTSLRETFAEFTTGDPGTSEIPSSREAAECFPEFKAHTVRDALVPSDEVLERGLIPAL